MIAIQNLKSRLFTFLLISLPLMTTFTANAQKISSADKKELRKKEDSLAAYSRDMVFSPDAAVRFRADSNFIRGFVRALKVKNSFG